MVDPQAGVAPEPADVEAPEQADATPEPAEVEDPKPADGEAPKATDLEGERWYEHGAHYVTWEEFRECPMGRDILRGDPHECEAQCLNAFTKLMTREEHEAVGDRWALQEMADTGTPWKFLSTSEKVEAVVVNFVKFCSIWGVLYMFIIALGLMGDAFKILGGRSSGRAFRESELLANPVAGLAIGILATVLMQSSSTTTSIVISMAAAELVSVKNAAYLVMGANIGTSVTNTIVSIAHLNSPEEYRRAFTGAVFHDMFNWLTVGIFLPLEASSGFLMELAGAAVDSMNLGSDKRGKVEFIKKITHPASGRVVSVDKKLIEKIAQAESEEKVKELEKHTIIKQKSGHVFRDTPISDEDAGVLLLFVSLTMLTTCLLLLVKLLQSVLKGGVASWTRYLLNIDFKHPVLRACGGFDNFLLLLFGTGCTILVQSSSVFTSTLTPLVGIGLIHVEKLVALTHGANIGTTVTGVLSALSGDNVVIGMRVALEHVFFNVLGTVVWFFIWPLRPIPLALAKFMGETAHNLRWFPIAYIVLAFLAFPGIVLVLSIPGWRVLVAVGVPLVVLVVVALVLIWVRRNRADLLPRGSVLRTEEVCGKRVPNFMRLWGGDLEKDKVDIAKMQRKEEEEKAAKAQATEWPQAPGAWGLAILAFIGITLALPTSQWRRMRYAQEARGRKEYGFGLYEVCTDDFKKDHQFASEPPVCDLAFMQQCANELELSCAADAANPSDEALEMREAVYARAWERCTRAGCRTYHWATNCPKLPSCAGRANHATLCDEELGPKGSGDFTPHVRGQEENGVVYDFSLAQEEAAEGRVVYLPHDNHFTGDAGHVASYSMPSQALAGTVTRNLNAPLTCENCDVACGAAGAATGMFCNDAPGLRGIGYDPCSGDLFAVTGPGPATACAGSTLLALEGFEPSFSTLRLHSNYSNDALVRTMTVEPWTPFSHAAGTYIGADADASNLVGDGPQPWTQATCATRSKPLAAGKKGLAVSDIQVLGDGVFIGTEDFGNAIVVWNASGHVLATYTPGQVLPESFNASREGRGLAGVAVHPDKKKIATCMKSPMGAGSTLLKSNVVRCAVIDITDVAAAVLVAEKVLLQSDVAAEYTSELRNASSTQADVQYSAVSWLSGDKILLLETAVSGSALAMTLQEADLSTGTDIKGKGYGTELEGWVVDAKDELVLNPAVALVSRGVAPVTVKKVYDLTSLEKNSIGDSIEGMFVASKETVVLVEDGKFAAQSRVHVLHVGEVLAYSAPSCPYPKTRTLKATTHCRSIGDVCPVGGLEGDMQAVAGLVITGAVFMGLGTLTIVAYSLVPHHAVVGKFIYVSFVCMVIAWVLILASWAHVAEMSKKEYGCLFLDESARSESRGGGYVLLKGELQYITRPSYSWAFAIYSWGMLTISLCFIGHHVLRLTLFPEEKQEDAIDEPIKEK